MLFIDEAYYLYRPENERDYGQESIEILLQVMETERDELVVVLAGYKDRMDTFFRSNPGMGSRVAHHIHFPDYSVDELMTIGQMMLERRAYQLSPDAEVAFRDYVERRVAQPRFANARSIRNAIDRARMRQAGRLFELDGGLTRDQLITIEADDILRSSLFEDHADDVRPQELPHPTRREGDRCPVRSSSASSATPPPARPRSRAASSACSASSTSPTSRPTTTTATTASSARSAASRRCTPTATTSTSWSRISPSCTPAARS